MALSLWLAGNEAPGDSEHLWLVPENGVLTVESWLFPLYFCSWIGEWLYRLSSCLTGDKPEPTLSHCGGGFGVKYLMSLICREVSLGGPV